MSGTVRFLRKFFKEKLKASLFKTNLNAVGGQFTSLGSVFGQMVGFFSGGLSFDTVVDVLPWQVFLPLILSLCLYNLGPSCPFTNPIVTC